MKRMIPMILCLLLLTGCSPKETVIQGFSMDASYRIKAEGISKEQEVDIQKYINKIDSVMNVYREDSLISDFNRTKSLTVSTSEDRLLFDIIQKTLPYCNDVFDISIRPVSKLWNFKSEEHFLPNAAEISENLSSVGYQNIELSDNGIRLKNGAEIECGAITKGYVCDRIAEMLSEKNALIDFGGTVKTVGKEITAGVKSPDHNGLLCSFTLPNGTAVSTSGSYERSFISDEKLYHHILDPKTGYPVETNLVSVTVICESAFTADILSTTLFAKNKLEIPEIAEVIYVTNDNLAYVSPGVQNFKMLNDTYRVITLKKD